MVERYNRYIPLPWQKDLAGAQRAIFVVYDKSEERRLRARLDLFAIATKETGHGWKAVRSNDGTFATWMSGIDYRDILLSMNPDGLEMKLEEDFVDTIVARPSGLI